VALSYRSVAGQLGKNHEFGLRGLSFGGWAEHLSFLKAQDPSATATSGLPGEP
jgi:hypothetical protein